MSVKKFGNWKVAIPVFVVLAVVAVEVLIHFGLIRWNPELSADGLLVLAGGLLAFVAVMLQIDAEKRARKEKQEAEKRALATSFLFEIDGFYSEYLNPEERSKINHAVNNVQSRSTPLFSAWIGRPFEIYVASASQLGRLEQDTVRAIVQFYGRASTFVEAVKAHESLVNSSSINDSIGRENAKVHIKFAASSVEALTEKARDCCGRLCAVARINPADLQIVNEFPELAEEYNANR